MKFLVTGATGFLGQYIVERLAAEGKAVRAFCRRSSAALERPEIEVFIGDLRSAESCRAACCGIDAVFHTAALTGIGMNRRPFYETNVVGTENILAGCVAEGVRRLVYTGSPSVTDNGRPQEGVDESAARNYPNVYVFGASGPYRENVLIGHDMSLYGEGCPVGRGAPPTRGCRRCRRWARFH